MNARIRSFLAALLLPLAVAAQDAQRLVERLDASQPLHTAAWGVLAVNTRGDTLASLRPDAKLTPASNMKLITTGVALHLLGPEHRFETRIGYSGTLDGGTLSGDVYILGGGDPTLAANDSTAAEINQVFARWKALLTQAGIRRITGRIIGDGRLIGGQLEDASWEYDDVGTYYGTGGNGLSFYENVLDIAVKAGPAAGEPPILAPVYPKTPWMHFDWICTTGPAGSGNSLYLYTTDLAPYAEMRGSFAVDRRPRTEHCANKYGALTCAYYFAEYLRATGLPVAGYADIDRHGRIRESFDAPGEAAADREALTLLGGTLSPTLRQIARETNHRSHNFYAEALLRAVSLRLTGSALADSCLVAEAAVLADLGVPAGAGLHIRDGSGLSRHNFMSPGYMVRFLQAMRGSPHFEAWLRGLPQPGSNGTLRNVMPKAPGPLRSRIFLKSGSMNGVLCYSGYIFPADPASDNVICFSLMTNNCEAPVTEVRGRLMQIISALAGQ